MPPKLDELRISAKLQELRVFVHAHQLPSLSKANSIEEKQWYMFLYKNAARFTQAQSDHVAETFRTVAEHVAVDEARKKEEKGERRKKKEERREERVGRAERREKRAERREEREIKKEAREERKEKRRKRREARRKRRKQRNRKPKRRKRKQKGSSGSGSTGSGSGSTGSGSTGSGTGASGASSASTNQNAGSSESGASTNQNAGSTNQNAGSSRSQRSSGQHSTAAEAAEGGAGSSGGGSGANQRERGSTFQSQARKRTRVVNDQDYQETDHLIVLPPAQLRLQGMACSRKMQDQGDYVKNRLRQRGFHEEVEYLCVGTRAAVSLPLIEALSGTYFKKTGSFNQRPCYQRMGPGSDGRVVCDELHLFWSIARAKWKIGKLDDRLAGLALSQDDSATPILLSSSWLLCLPRDANS